MTRDKKHGQEPDVREAVSAAAKAFDDMALEFRRMRSGRAIFCWSPRESGRARRNVLRSNLQYSWIAKVTRDPTPQGLDGGRVRFFDLVRTADPPVREAPDLKDAEKYERWLHDLPPRNIHVARYKDGKLNCYVDDPVTGALIEEIKETCARWESTRPAPPLDHALSAARDALFNLELEHGLSGDGEKAHDLCSAALERLERENQDSQRILPGKEGATEKDEAIARAIEKVKQKEDDERQAGDRDQGRELGKE